MTVHLDEVGAPLSLTDRHRADPVKSGGVHYTPDLLAAFVAQQALKAVGNCTSLKVLDPACGDGALLAAVANESTAPDSLQLVGFDLDASAVEIAGNRLSATARGTSVQLMEADFIEAALNAQEYSLPALPDQQSAALNGGFDLAIANPPYVRTQVLGAKKARRLAADFGLTGRVDLYQAFAVAMTAALRPGGVLALLCSNRFLTTKAGHSLREVLASKCNIEDIFDLGDTKVFEAAVLPAVIIARRSKSGSTSIRMASIYESRVTAEVGHEASSIFEALTGDLDGPVKVGDLDFEIRRGNVDVSDASKPWIPSSPAGDAWLAGVGRATALQFGDVSKLKVGVKTTADSVFISDRWAYEDPTPDRELLLPLITHHVANRWTAGPTTSRILYPYDLQAEKRTPLDMADYPKTAEYLETHRARLEGRKYVSDGGRQWWEIWVPQSPSAWALPKIVWPDISERPKFFLDTSGAVVNGDCYWMTVEDQDLALLMLAVANSDLGISYYDAVCGNKLYAGRRRFMTQYVRGFPLPNRTHPAVVELIPKVRELVSGAASERTAELESDVSRLVAQSFGVE